MYAFIPINKGFSSFILYSTKPFKSILIAHSVKRKIYRVSPILYRKNSVLLLSKESVIIFFEVERSCIFLIFHLVKFFHKTIVFSSY